MLRSDREESVRYWEQFQQSQAQTMTKEEWQKRRKRNFRLMGYCIVAMLVSIGAHFIFFW